MIERALGLYLKSAYRALDQSIRNPIKYQEKWWKHLIESGKNCAFGTDHGFESITNITQFKQQVPIREYDDIKPYITSAIEGKQDVLWPGKTTWFSMSSGTTSDRSKYIPVTKESLQKNHYRSSTQVFASYFNRCENPNLFSLKKRGIIIGGSHQIRRDSNARYGDLSSVLLSNMPRYSQFFLSPKPDVLISDDWDRKIQQVAKITSKQDVTNISGIPTWSIALFRILLQTTGKDSIHEVWPNFKLFVHGGVSFKPFRKEVQRYLDTRKTDFIETYNASEGFFAFQTDPGSDELQLLTDHGIFYEFRPISESEAVSLADVEVDKEYAIILSTVGGLWRYEIGDTVRFTSINPHKLIISGRTQHFINLMGEELMVHQTEKAVAHCNQVFPSHITEYTVAPVPPVDGKKGRHEWLVEWHGDKDCADEYMNALDRKLRELNSDYDAKRKNNVALEAPSLVLLPKNSFEHWLRRKNRLGGQHKIPKLQNHQKLAAELLAQ